MDALTAIWAEDCAVCWTSAFGQFGDGVVSGCGVSDCREEGGHEEDEAHGESVCVRGWRKSAMRTDAGGRLGDEGRRDREEIGR